MHRVFTRIDTDKSGSINKIELKDALSKSTDNVTKESIEKIIKSVDNNDDGEINYTEFLASTVDPMIL